MNMEIGTEAAQIQEKEYINGIYVAVYYTTFYNLAGCLMLYQSRDQIHANASEHEDRGKFVRNGGYVGGGGREMHKINAPPNNNCLRCQNR
jgi:hypothetical protein